MNDADRPTVNTWTRWGMHAVAATALILAATAAACGAGNGGSGSGFGVGGGGGGPGSGGSTGPFGSGGGIIGQGNIASVDIQPGSATIVSKQGAPAQQAFELTIHHTDGSTSKASSGVAWSASNPQVGAIGADGIYRASGSIGGVVEIGASIDGHDAKPAALTVKLTLEDGTTGLDPSVISALEGATAPDMSIVWAYPYDGTVWPRGLLAPILQWNGGAPTDTYLVHLKSATFEYEGFATVPSAPAAQFPLDATTWQEFVDSTSGDTEVKVSRWDGANATLLVDHTWTVAPASMRGTIYYWSNNLGRVLRIKPGAAMPDDFANQAPLNDPAQYTQSSCLMTCHTVSADGSTIVSGGGVFGGSYDLKTSTVMTYLGGTWDPLDGAPASSSVVKWSNSAVSPTGKYILTNSMAEGLALANDGVTTGFLGMYTTADGMPVPTSGLMGVPVNQPAWSPEGSRIAFLDAGDPTPWAGQWNEPPPGDLKVYQFDESHNPMASGEKTLVAAGTDPTQKISWPTMTPDGKWIVYERGVSDTRDGNGDLYIASAITPNMETRLAKLDGDGYPFAAGARDASYNFEPSSAPVAAGGYFWVVFTSRRTYGNRLTGDKTVVKQIWVAAIDQNPKAGKDPSHAPFHLTGQDEGNLAMRGFWALDPCKGDGQGCDSGTECCGGYCDGSGDAGAAVCKSQTTGCSGTGDKCNKSSDCCGSSGGVTCINHVCSEPPPQ